MTLTEEKTHRPIISKYTPGKVGIGEKIYQTSLIITPVGEVIAWTIQNLDLLQETHYQEMAAYKPELIIIGTGEKHLLPNLAMIHYFSNYKIGIEVMSTGAACRTYNILALEDRNILAALII